MINNPFYAFLCVVLSALMIHMPAFALANRGMISTGEVVAQLDRAEAQTRVLEYVRSAEIQKLLVERGVSPDEASARLARLSESELRDLAGQMDRAQAGGDILVTVLIVVLIIFLIRKM